MKTNDTNNSKSEHAKNEKRDSQGRFESSDKKSMSSSSKTTSSKSSDMKNQKKDSSTHSKK